MNRKRYIAPEANEVSDIRWEMPLCESTGALPPLEESDDMEGLGWN